MDRFSLQTTTCATAGNRRGARPAAVALLALATVAGIVAIARPAQAASGAPAIVLAADVGEHSSTGHFEVLEDRSGKLTLAAVIAVEGSAWHLVNHANPNFGFTHAVYWGRFRLDNPLATPAERLVVFRYPLIDWIELFVMRADGSHERHLGGDHLPYSQRERDDHLIAFDLIAPAAQTQWIYFRVSGTSSMQLGFDVFTPARMTKDESNLLFRHGAYYGLMLALALYNAFLFLAIRNRAYFWYVVYTIAFTFTQMGLDGMAGRYLFPEHPLAANTFTPTMVAVLLAPPLLFAQEFLATRQNLPRMHKVVTVIIALCVLPVGMGLFGPYSVSIRVAAASAIFVSLLCAVLGFMVLAKGYRPARYYVIAWSAVIIGTILYVLVSFGLLPPNTFFNNIQRIGSGLEVVLLSFALGDHISSINKEKDSVKAEAVALERDLAVGGAVQQLFLPKQDHYRSSSLSLRGFYAPAARCGGDWWWYEPLSHGRVQVLLGDVTGHGAGAAMVTAGVAAAYRSLPEATRHGGDVRAVVAALNNSLVSICAGAHHMTLAAVEIDPGRGLVRFWSAGAPAALLMHKDGTIDHLGAAGRPLGEPELVVGQAEAALHPGDRLFIFSDGLPEMTRANGRQLGYRGVSRMLQETLGQPNEEARAQLTASLDEARKQQPQLDDIAFVLIDLDGLETEQKAA